LASVKLDGLDEERVRAQAQEIDSFLRALPEVTSGEVKVLGPAPSPIERIRARYRMQTLVRAAERPPLRRVLMRLANHLEHDEQAGVRVVIDVDPVQML